MDWIDWHFVAGIWVGLASVALGCLLALGLLRAGRSWRQRRSEPRPRFLSAEEIRDVEAAEKERRWAELANPQPTSQPPSEPTTGRGPGSSEPLIAKAALIDWRRAGRESED